MKEYTILHNPSEAMLNRYATNGWRIVSCVPSISTRGQGFIETVIVVIMEKEVSE